MPKLVLISNPVTTMSECDTIVSLMEAGVDQFHLRKPDGDEDALCRILNRLPKDLRPAISIHGYRHLAIRYKLGGLHLPAGENFENWSGAKSRSLHKIEEWEQYTDLDYAFLSPVFDSISKQGYKTAFDQNDLTEALKKPRSTKLIALGGIDVDTARKAIEMGFDGIAVMGAIWNELWLGKKIDKIKALKEVVNTVPA